MKQRRRIKLFEAVQRIHRSNRPVEKHCGKSDEKLGVEDRIAAAREWILR